MNSNMTSGNFNTTELPQVSQRSNGTSTLSYLNSQSFGTPGILTSETVTTITNIMNCYVIPPVVLFGLFGNILSMIILMGKSFRNNSTNIVLAYLALIDTLFLIVTFLRKISCIVASFDQGSAYILDVLSVTYPIIFEIIFGRISNLCSLIICTERYIAVFKPLKVKLWVTRGRMLIIMVFITVLVFSTLSVNFPVYSLTWHYSPRYNRSIPRITISSFYLNNKNFFGVYNNVVLSILLRLLPSFTIMAQTLAIIVKLRRRRAWLRGNAGHSEESESNKDKDAEVRSVTNMLMTIVVIFIVCLLPGNVGIICSFVDERYSARGALSNEFRLISTVATFTETVNASANFVVYVAMNKKFSTVLSHILCPFRKKPSPVLKPTSSRLTLSTSM